MKTEITTKQQQSGYCDTDIKSDEQIPEQNRWPWTKLVHLFGQMIIQQSQGNFSSKQC